MRAPSRRAVLMLAVLVLLPAAAAGQVTDWRQVPEPPLRAFSPVQPRRLTLPNGLVILLQEDHELPLVQAFARVRGGTRDEPAEKAGLATLFGEVWRTGGTRARTGDELDDFLEARAARVETGASLDSTSVSLDCLKGNLAEVFEIFADLIREPALREDKLVLAKGQLATAIARRNDDPSDIADREARRLGYGKDSPFARNEEYATAAAVERTDLVDWHARYVRPNNTILGVVGDFDPAKVEAMARRAFGSWRAGQPLPKPAWRFEDPKPGVYFVAKDDVNQSNIRMVHLGTTKNNPDYYAIEVMNEILGGGFASRLFSNVRSRRGLAYAVYGGVGTNFDYPGLLQLSMATKSETTAAAIDALYEEVAGLSDKPPSDEELKRAKEAILNSFVFRFDSREKVLRERMRYEFYGYPADFLERYRGGIERVTLSDVESAARKYVHKERIALLVVGRAADFDRPLSSFGPVTAIDVAIPGAPER